MKISQTKILHLTEQWQAKMIKFVDEAHRIEGRIHKDAFGNPTTPRERSENLHGYAAGYAAARNELLRLIEGCACQAKSDSNNIAGAIVQERLVRDAFAPGPWHVGEANPWLVCAADGYAVADLRAYHGRHSDTKADARLIAAAPEMLEALERIREYQGRFGEDDPQSIAADMLAKIYSSNAKAQTPPDSGTKDHE